MKKPYDWVKNHDINKCDVSDKVNCAGERVLLVGIL